jgi:PAS domain S-box-containing protein
MLLSYSNKSASLIPPHCHKSSGFSITLGNGFSLSKAQVFPFAITFIIVQNITEGIIISDLNGIVTFTNPSLLNMLGYSAEEFIGSHLTAVVPVEHHREVEAADARRLQGKADRYELIFKHKNGALLPFQVSGSPYHDYVTGEVAGTVAVLTDTRKLKKAHDVIKASEERLRLMTRNIMDVVIEIDVNGFCTYISSSAFLVLGRGDEIPLEGRIVAICAAYYAMVNPRSYARTLNQDKALKELKCCAGTQFDPQLVNIFIKILSEDKNTR